LLKIFAGPEHNALCPFLKIKVTYRLSASNDVTTRISAISSVLTGASVPANRRGSFVHLRMMTSITSS
ncbi:hypothetical protein ACLB0U_005506, partial [Klebsiella pneumoniae]